MTVRIDFISIPVINFYPDKINKKKYLHRFWEVKARLLSSLIYIFIVCLFSLYSGYVFNFALIFILIESS